MLYISLFVPKHVFAQKGNYAAFDTLELREKTTQAMIANELLSKCIIPLKTSDTGEEALSIMSDFYVRELPIVNNKQLLGLISEEDILGYDVKEPVGSFQLSKQQPYVKEGDHLYEILRVMHEHQLTVVPVVDLDTNYMGLISQEDVLAAFSGISSLNGPGGIIVLEMGKRDYSLHEIARIVESEGAAILSSFVTSSVDSMQVEVTIKVNRQEVNRIIATFERFDYKVKATFQRSNYLDSLKERFDSLMSYLSV